MALINDLYIHIESEDISNNMSITSNPVESGLALTDHAEREPFKLSLKGKLIDNDNISAYEQYTKLRNWEFLAKQVKYVGRNIVKALITSVKKTNDYSIENGANVTIELQEIRIANTPYNEKSVLKKSVVNVSTPKNEQSSNESAGEDVYHTVKKGEYLGLIAKKYGTSVSWLMQNNKSIKNANLINIGQKILVKKG